MYKVIIATSRAGSGLRLTDPPTNQQSTDDVSVGLRRVTCGPVLSAFHLTPVAEGGSNSSRHVLLLVAADNSVAGVGVFE